MIFFTLRFEKVSTNRLTQIYAGFFLLSFPSELPASFALCEFEGTNLQHVNINELHDCQVWNTRL